MINRFFSIVVIVLMTISIIPYGPSAASPESSDDRTSNRSLEGTAASRISSENNQLGGSIFEDIENSAPDGSHENTYYMDGKVQLIVDEASLTKYIGNPVLTPTPAKWDSLHIRSNSILYENGIFRMWYGGKATLGPMYGEVGYATSLDGKTWTKQNGGNPVLIGNPSGWDIAINQVFVIRNNNELRMYYSATDASAARIGIATSTDGISWTKYAGNPIFEGDGTGFDSWHTGTPCVLKDDNVWKMYYHGGDTVTTQIGYATSADGITNWNRNNLPVVGFGANGKFDSVGTSGGYVIKRNNGYFMYYTGYDGNKWELGLANSKDGINWIRLNNGNPVLNIGGGGAWDSYMIAEHSVLQLPNRIYVYYGAGQQWEAGRIGLAIADKLETTGYYSTQQLSIPNSQYWDRLYLKKAEPAGTSLKVTVFNGITDQSVQGYTNRTETNINISGLNDLGIKSVILRFYLTGQGSSTPSLYSWGIDHHIENAWRRSFVGGNYVPFLSQLWMRKGEIVLDADPCAWNKTISNPILKLGGAGEWDSTQVSNPTVLFNGLEYQLYYAGLFTTYQTGTATSNDGITWSKDPTNPGLPAGTGGSWDDQDVGISAVLFNDDGYHSYKSWYMGYDGQQLRIGYAVSDTGQSWIKDPSNPILDGTGGGTWDDYVSGGDGVHGPTVLLINGTYYLWYAGRTGSGYFNIGLATSKDGTSFTKTANNQVMTGTSGKFDSGAVHNPSVIFRRDQYRMFYEGDKGTLLSSIGYATSTDGITWKKQNNNNPILEPGVNGQWEDAGVGGPTVIFKDGLYHMYYHGYDGGIFQIGYAKSSFFNSGSFMMEPIKIPRNGLWNSILLNKTEPAGTMVTVDVLDAASGFPVPGFTGLKGADIDIQGINAETYPSLKLLVYLTGDGAETPTISDIGINWTIADVKFKGPIPDVSFPEDTLGDNLTTLSNYFNQSRIGPTGLVYSIASNTDPVHVGATFDADKIHIDYRSVVANWSGTSKLSVSASDGFMSVTSNIFNVTVTPVNDPPIWMKIPIQYLEGARDYNDSLNLSKYVTDIDTTQAGSVFSLVNVDAQKNLNVSVKANGSVSFKTGHYFEGLVNVTVSVNDGGVTLSTMFQVHINWSEPKFHSPEITSHPRKNATTGLLYAYDVEATDEDVGDILVFMLKAGPTGMTINPFTGEIQWTPNESQIGIQHVIINVSDQRGLFAIQEFDIEVVAPNELPYFTSTPELFVRLGDNWSYEPRAKDNDSLFLFIMMGSGPVGMKIDLLGTRMDWAPTMEGKFNVVIYAWDLEDRTYQNFTITVLPPNHSPSIAQIPSRSIKVGESYQYKVNATDPDGDTLVFSIKNMPSGMTIGTDGTISWNPKKQDIGTYTLTVDVFDGRATTSQTFTLKVEKKTVPRTIFESIMWPIIILIIILVIIVVVVIVYSKKRKDDREAKEAALMAQTSAPVRDEPAALPPTPPPAVPASTIDPKPRPTPVADFEDVPNEEPVVPPPAQMKKIEAGPKVTIDDETYSKEQILQKLTSLPRGLPSALWGKDMDDLSSELIIAEYSHNNDGEVIVKLGKRWYFGNPKDLGTYLQPYKDGK